VTTPALAAHTETPPTTVILPDRPPALDDAAWRTLLAVLVDAAKAELGPAWRSVLGASRAGVGAGD
jgi:hypothetical protein